MIRKIKNKMFSWSMKADKTLLIIADNALNIVACVGMYIVIRNILYAFMLNGFFAGVFEWIKVPSTWLGAVLANIGLWHRYLLKGILVRGIPLQLSNGIRKVIKIVTYAIIIVCDIISVIAAIVLLIDNYQYYGLSWGLLYGFPELTFYVCLMAWFNNLRILSFNEDKIQEELKDIINDENKELEEEEKRRKEKEMEKEEERRREEFRKQAEQNMKE